MSVSRALLLFVVWTAACAPGPPPAESRPARREAVTAAATLVVTPVEADVPPQSGALPLVAAVWRDGERDVPVAAPGPAVAAVEWDGAAAVVLADGTIQRVEREGASRRLGRDVVGTPAVSRDGTALVWVERRADGSELRVLRRGEPVRVVAAGLASAGAPWITPDGATIVFIGAGPGGVAGLQAVGAARPGGPVRCLTNCDLVVGEPWGDRLVPSPRSPSDLVLDGDTLSWTVDGRRFEVELGEAGGAS
jgi:hypothetical protein